MNIDDIEIGSPEHALALASCLEGQEEAVLGPSDIKLCVTALRGHTQDRRVRQDRRLRAIRRITADEPITVDLLERCLDRIALAMHKAGTRGSVYLPIFERLEHEIEQRRASESAMTRALRRLRQ